MNTQYVIIVIIIISSSSSSSSIHRINIIIIIIIMIITIIIITTMCISRPHLSATEVPCAGTVAWHNICYFVNTCTKQRLVTHIKFADTIVIHRNSNIIIIPSNIPTLSLLFVIPILLYLLCYTYMIIIIIIIIIIIYILLLLRPVRLLRVWVSEGLTQANS